MLFRSVRIVCATHQDLDAMIAATRFRDDLYYRLAEIVVRIPSLAERAGDASLLAHHFLGRFAKEHGRTIKGFTADALGALNDWSWPGNVRELENRLKRAVIMTENNRISAEDLDLGGQDDGGAALNLKSVREAGDRRTILLAIARSDGNMTNVAKVLGISRPTLYSLLKEYAIEV